MTDRTALRLQRQQQVVALGFKDLDAYYRSPHWNRMRDLYRASDLPQDCVCGACDKLVYLHHITYERLGAEPLEDLTPLCGACHNLIHRLINQRQISDLDLRKLISAARAKRYEAEVDAQKQRHASAAESVHERDTNKRVRSMAMRVRQLHIEAVRKGVDISLHTAVIEDALEHMATKLNP